MLTSGIDPNFDYTNYIGKLEILMDLALDLLNMSKNLQHVIDAKLLWSRINMEFNFPVFCIKERRFQFDNNRLIQIFESIAAKNINPKNLLRRIYHLDEFCDVSIFGCG